MISLSTLTSNPLITTSPSFATGTPLINLTEYSNTSPAAAAVTVPDPRSITGAPASASPASAFTTTDEESEIPVKVIVPVLSLSLPIVITVSPSIVDATSTLEEPPVPNEEGASEPRRVIVSLEASKSVIITFPSSPLTTPPPEKLTS